jgi:hypothetical protein
VNRRLLVWIGATLLAVVASVFIAAAVMLRPDALKARATAELSERLRLDATIDDLRVSLFPVPRVTGSGLTLRAPGRDDLPPFVSIARFDVAVGPISMWRQQVDTVHLEGLVVNVPPRDARKGMPDKPDGMTQSPILIRHLVSQDAVLRFIPSEPDKTPLTFELHEIAVDDVGFTRLMPFRARLTNPVPRGLVESAGRVGPWQPDDPTALPLEGAYTLTDADLSTINGIGGILQSEGRYEGLLTEIRATGATTMPDFSLELGGRPLPLDTTYTALINGTNGTTILEQVDATLVNSKIVASGAITNLAGPAGLDIEIESEVVDGRIEDMLALTIDSPEPLLTGDLTSKSTMHLPPGDSPVRMRLRLDGEFGLGRADFTNEQVQDKLAELSRRSQGQNEDEAAARVLTNLGGHFTMEAGIFHVRDLSFRVPGAEVQLAGSYDLASEAMNFSGNLRMDASVSEAVGGIKSIFIKPFDFIFRKDGAGAVVPLSVTGTWRSPKTNVDFGRVFRGSGGS